ncbi:MAG: hypothetical protein GH148_09405 [Clostridia bacterium]|nr:hypothetical protein [Clostridia bacterium]
MMKLIVTDVDGTLLDNNSILTGLNKKAIQFRTSANNFILKYFDITLSCVRISFLNLKYNYFIIKY